MLPEEFREAALVRVAGYAKVRADAVRSIFSRGHIHDTGAEGNPDNPVYGLKVINPESEVHIIQVQFKSPLDPREVEVCDVSQPQKWTAEALAGWIYVVEKYMLPRQEEIAVEQAKSKKGHCPVCGERMH